jgi:uncharacterized membrane protein
MVIIPAICFTGFAVAFGFAYLLPQFQLGGFIIAFAAAVVAPVGIRELFGNWKVAWVAFAAVAIAGIGTMMLAEDLSLARVGETKTVFIADHSVDVKVEHDSNSVNGRKVYTHTYSLKEVGGQALNQPLIYRGKGGYEDIHKGDTVEVLIDPEGKAPAQPVENVNIAAGRGILISGVIVTAIVFGIFAAVLPRVQARRAEHESDGTEQGRY